MGSLDRTILRPKAGAGWVVGGGNGRVNGCRRLADLRWTPELMKIPSGVIVRNKLADPLADLLRGLNALDRPDELNPWTDRTN